MTDALSAVAAPDRAILRVEGADAAEFLQGLLTNDVTRATGETSVYAALLSPQGKFLADALIWRPEPELFLLETAAALAGDFEKRLTLYKLRAQLAIARDAALRTLLIWREDGADPETAPPQAVAGGPDPRAPALGRRYLLPDPEAAIAALAARGAPYSQWEARRLALGVPAAGSDLRPNDGYPLEYGFERLSGVDFKKGCFVGQEIVARMKHKTELKKGLFRLSLDGPAPEPGTDVLADGKPAGSIGSSQDRVALALLRIDRVGAPLTAGGARVVSVDPAG